MPHLFHDGSLSFQHIGGWSAAAVAQGIGQCGCYQGTVGACQFMCRPGEMQLCHSLYSVDAISHFDGVQVNLHDAFLAPDQLDEYSKIHLQPLSHPTGCGPQKHILGGLLTDGAASAITPACLPLLDDLADGVEIKSSVLQVILVLAGYHCYRHVDRHRVQWHPVVSEPHLFPPRHLLHTADEHQGGHIDRYPTVEDNKKDCTPKEQEYNPSE